MSFKYLWVLFTSNEEGVGKLLDNWHSTAVTVLQSLYSTVVTKRDLSRKAKLSIYTELSSFLLSPMVMKCGIG